MEQKLLPDNFTRKAPDARPTGTTHATLAKAHTRETPLRVGGSGGVPTAAPLRVPAALSRRRSSGPAGFPVLDRAHSSPQCLRWTLGKAPR